MGAERLRRFVLGTEWSIQAQSGHAAIYQFRQLERASLACAEEQHEEDGETVGLWERITQLAPGTEESKS